MFGGLSEDQRRHREKRPPPGPQLANGRSGRLRWSPSLSEDGSIRLSDVPIARDVLIAGVYQWLGETEEQLGRPVAAAAIAIEYQKNGWPHAHPLISIKGGLRRGDIETIGRPWWDRHGQNKLEVPRSVAAVTSYSVKYLIKDLERGDLLFWPVKGRLGG